MTEALLIAMQAQGWRYDPASAGWRRGTDWVGAEQAERAFEAAEAERVFDRGLGMSKTLAKIVVAEGANDAG